MSSNLSIDEAIGQDLDAFLFLITSNLLEVVSSTLDFDRLMTLTLATGLLCPSVSISSMTI